MGLCVCVWVHCNLVLQSQSPTFGCVCMFEYTGIQCYRARALHRVVCVCLSKLESSVTEPEPYMGLCVYVWVHWNPVRQSQSPIWGFECVFSTMQSSAKELEPYMKLVCMFEYTGIQYYRARALHAVVMVYLSTLESSVTELEPFMELCVYVWVNWNLVFQSQSPVFVFKYKAMQCYRARALQKVVLKN